MKTETKITIDKKLDSIKDVKLTSNALEKANEVISKLKIETNHQELKNGLELTITAQLFLELCSQYPVKRMLKKRLNDFLLEAEKDIEKEYNKVYESSPEFCTNSIRMREKFIKNIAQLHEADFILLEDFVEKFIKNLPIARQKGIVFFEKLNQ